MHEIEYTTIAKASKLVGLEKQELQLYCRSGLLPYANKKNGRWYVAIDSLFPFFPTSEARKVLKGAVVALQIKIFTVYSAVGLAAHYLDRGESIESATRRVELEFDIPYETIRAWHSLFAVGGLSALGANSHEQLTLIGKMSKSEAELDEYVRQFRYDGEVELIIESLSSCKDREIKAIREKLELKGWGNYLAKANPDRRLYAVLKATRKENIQRIKFILYFSGCDPEVNEIIEGIQDKTLFA